MRGSIRMFYIGLKLKNVLSRSSVLGFGLIGMLIFSRYGYATTAGTDLLSLETGFRQMYNLDFAAAHKTFETWQEQHPDDPLGAASNGAAYLFAEFERLHILELNLFTEK